MTINLQRLREDAEHLTVLGSDPVAERLAHNMILILDNPHLLISSDYAIVRKPELLDKGVPYRG